MIATHVVDAVLTKLLVIAGSTANCETLRLTVFRCSPHGGSSSMRSPAHHVH